MNAKPKFGVALYADGTPFCREGNVACEFRGEPFAFSSVSDLPAQTVWVTNATLNDLIEAGLHKNPKLAHDGYFRTRLAQVAQELGLSQMSMDSQASFLAELLGGCIEMARLQMGLTQYPSAGLTQAVGQLYGCNEPPARSAMAQLAEQACQRYTACERSRRYENPDVFSFWKPRQQWADMLINEPLPSAGPMRALPAHALPSMGQDTNELVEWALAEKIPLFAKIKILGLEPTVGQLMNYGAGANDVVNRAGSGEYIAKNLREWCALPELEALAQVGDIQVQQVVVADGWRSSGLKLQQGRLASVSYGYGLLAENLWVGLTRKPSQYGNVSRSISTAWLQAIDRMQCLKVAERLTNLGMEVANYGNGRITVACPQSVRALIPQVALEEGLLYPASLPDLKLYTPNQQNPTHVMQHLISSRDYGRMVSVDQALLKQMVAASAA